MSRNDHRFDPRNRYDDRGSDRRDERGGGRGSSSGGYSDGRYRDDQQQYGDQRQHGEKRGRGDNSGREPRYQYGGQGSGVQQRERDRGYDHGSGSGSGMPRHEYRGNGGMSFTAETQGYARFGFSMGSSSTEQPGVGRAEEERQRQAGEGERAAAHREQSAPEPARGERGQTQSGMWTGASDDAVEVQRERIRGLIFRASAASQGLFGKLEDNLMTKVWGYVEMDVWTYAGVLAVVKKRPRWWMTLAGTNTTLGALKRCGHRTMQEHPVGKLVARAATYGWLPRLARDVDEQDYAELSDKFKAMVRRGDIGTVGKRADKVMNQFDSILRPGMEERFGRAAPAIALLREAVERGWKSKLARDVAAMVGAAADSDDDDDMPDMS